MKGATSARELMLGTSKFLAARGADPRSQRWRMMMASHAIQQQARLWYAARWSASDDVARSDGEKQVGPAQSSAG